MVYKRPLVLFLYLLYFSFISPCSAASPEWEQTQGPHGGTITAFTANGSSLYAGTWGAGVYRSIDSGSSWTRATGGLPALIEVVDLAVTGNTVFVATRSNGVYRSQDDGQTWSPANSGLRDLSIDQLLARGSDLLVLSGAEPYLSTNLGDSWQSISAPTGLTALVANGSVILGVSGLALGLYRTTDDGQSWELTPGIGLVDNFLEEFAVSGATIFGARINSSPGHVYKSLDNGDNWIQLDLGTPDVPVEGLGILGAAFFVISAPDNPLYRSPDDGDTWVSVNPSGLAPGQGRIINRLFGHGTTLFGGTPKGVFQSPDLGDNWQEANQGFVATQIEALASHDQRLFATVGYFPQTFVVSISDESTTLDAVQFSSNGGDDWDSGHAGIPDGTNVKSLAVKGTSLFAGTAREGVFRSTDGGLSWTPARNGLPEPYGTYGEICGLVASGSSLLAATRPRSVGGGHGSVQTQGGGVHRSTNDGADWFPVNTGIPLLGVHNPPNSLQYYPFPISLTVVDSVLFFATEEQGIFRSDDDGDSWAEVNAGLPTSQGRFPKFSSFVGLGADIYASSWGFHAGIPGARGLFRSADGGLSWDQLGGLLADNRPVAALLGSGGDLVAALGCPGTSHYFPGCSNDPADGVYSSGDGGLTWARMGSSLDGIPITSLQLQGSSLFAGSSGSGVWRISTCPADVNNDNAVDVVDFLALLAAWGPCPGCPEDINGDGVVDVVDFLALLAAWGACP
jgi:photosystem II stability/assembly factor-like uncharacterized protein